MADSLKELEGSELAAKVREDLREWESVMGDWVEEAQDSYAMVAGDQWSDADVQAMNDQKRPMVTLNRIASTIRGVCGLEVSQRMEARYLAREMGDVQATEVQNAAARWVREGCNAEDEESDAFRDMLTTGLGWTETRIEYDRDPEGQIVIERVDPLQMRWDPLAVKKGLMDSRWRARIKTMSIEEVKRQWPDKEDELLAYVEENELELPVHHATTGDGYDGKTSTTGQKATQDEVTVVQYQYFEHEYYVKVMDPSTGQTTDVEEERFKEAAKIGMPGMPVARFKKRCYKQTITCGPVELENVDLNVSDFTLQCMTGSRDRNKGIWYGLVRDLKDPQRWSNKFFSTVIDTLATNAKGGVMGETSAVEDPRRFEEDWANPRATVWLKPGGLQKISPRPMPAIPPQMGQVMEFAISSMPQISGINLEFLGMADRNQPGILEYHRKQSVASSLAEFFSALRQYRKTQGIVLLEMIYAYIADGRLIRVVGQQGEAYIPFYKQAEVRYDVVVDEAATAPDRKMQTWLALMELLPMAMQSGMPVPPSVLDYSPLPTSLAQEWKQMMQNSPPIPEEVQKQMDEGMKQIEQLQKENMQLKDKKAEQQAELQLKAQEQQADLQMRAQQHQLEQQQMQIELAFEREKLTSQMQIEREKAANQITLEREKAMAQIQLEREKTMANIDLQREKAVLDASIKEQIGMANIEAQYQFERDGRKITGVSDHKGNKYSVDRDPSGNLIGLRAMMMQ